ncbi:MAG TPA: 4Fe-4S binding protein [Candidatus Avacidaminococcus intestinavium]|uniref:4Fe-4S binding protein n=1 Tax=Candidatus Avacidaminococcus intestinavium TaxID=2840684 RepID=A0A9D1MNZ1_9FIRM|nr:4Fe-4S binding protein [Candidatus Avacidaminococcus intestinavium]
MKIARAEYLRVLGYLSGFILFFAPFALFQKGLAMLLGLPELPYTIHNLCFRIPIEHLLSGRFFAMGTIALVGTIILLLTALIFGPLFCGFLCPAGAVPEYLSRLVPCKYKINWSKYLPVSALRYGFLFGFMLAPFTGGLIACAYCNFYVFDLLFNYSAFGYIVAYSSSLLLTMLFWLVFFGLFTQGGRGFCLFFCPVGAVQNLTHYLGSFLPFTKQLFVRQSTCIKCNLCVKACPMTALKLEDSTLVHDRHICILCMECVKVCPTKSINYGCNRKKDD